MKGKTKALLISFLIFVIVCIIALYIVLNKGVVFGKQIVSTGETASGEEVKTYDISLETEKEYLSAKSEEETKLIVKVDGVETTEGVVFSSSNEEVLTVDDAGTVTAVGAGSATITAKCEESEATVDIKAIIPITNIHFTSTSSSIRVGNDLQLKLQISPSNASIDSLEYISSDEEIATVNKNGIVRGKKTGRVTITLHDKYTDEEKSVNLTIR